MHSNIYIEDFIIVYGYHSEINELNFGNSYNLYENVPNIRLYYKKNIFVTNYFLRKYEEKLFIHFMNSFFPLFVYQYKNIKILALKFTNLLKIRLEFTIDKRSIQEFVLYHIPLNERTFYQQVRRLVGIESIVVKQGSISINYKKINYSTESVYNQFIKNIDCWVEKTKDEKHAVFLSGGLEFRINAAVADAYELNKTFVTWGHPAHKEYIIAKKISNILGTPILNIRPDITRLPYEEFLLNSGFLSNMVSSYRYAVVKQLFKNFGFKLIWTGLGDINGYPVRYQPSELFSAYYLGLYNGKQQLPPGWNKEWLMSYSHKENPVIEQISADPGPKTFFKLKKEIFAPAIFGAVLGAENTIGFVFAPWFDPEIYNSVQYEENQNPKLISNKIWRTMWKNNLYYQIIKKYCPKLNYIKNAKGYYPVFVNKYTSFAGLLLAALMKKYASKKRYPFDPVEDRTFIQIELEKILDSNFEIFDKGSIEQIIKQKENWRGPDILEYFKLIQIHWFLNLQHEYEK